ncbi:hypothetical protein H7E67_19560 [Clostridium gasigenes]|nr:hypothetical protein [Clostridium gasigenes]MBU3090298.1 hypothetical protein [Clostridium gasigenes]MBU3106119.1 hypothetical protein [Clostridium gasigenes]MBU3133134.1 hypothetical protein [Clostridium gasigenes]MBU3136150.1 hypothetical protein [Clostridium gasigenes]
MKQMVYRYIGSGSGRKVFDLGNGYVIKVAKNIAGIAQNQVEYQISFNDNSNLFAKVIEVSGDFKFLIMKKADTINNFSHVLKYFNVSNSREFIRLKGIQTIQWKYNLLLADLCKKSSWGIIDGIPVIIDYGFTKQVQRRYY